MSKQHYNGQDLVDPASIEIDPELQHLVPKHRKSEVALMERSLTEEKGCREALHVWDHDGKLILLDGHTRRELCLKLGFKVPIRKVELADKDAAKAYVKKVQLGRRNTPDHAESYLRGSHYNELKGTRGGDRRSKGKDYPLVENEDGAKGKPDPLIEDTAEKLAKEYEVSARTIKLDAQFARLLDKVLHDAGMTDKRWELLSGDVRLNRGAVKKLSLLQGKELKKQVEYLLKEGRLPRKKTEQEGTAKQTVKSQVASFVSKLEAKDEKLPVAFLKEMASKLGFKLVEATPAKKSAKESK
jgi:hypothetical protein